MTLLAPSSRAAAGGGGDFTGPMPSSWWWWRIFTGPIPQSRFRRDGYGVPPNSPECLEEVYCPPPKPIARGRRDPPETPPQVSSDDLYLPFPHDVIRVFSVLLTPSPPPPRAVSVTPPRVEQWRRHPGSDAGDPPRSSVGEPCWRTVRGMWEKPTGGVLETSPRAVPVTPPGACAADVTGPLPQ